MCGIFGYFDRRGTPMPDEVLRRMGESIRHRGPDDYGVHVEDAVAVGNRRLSIIDLAGGHQPFHSDDGLITVVQNGEIFNHVELAEELAKSGHPCRTRSDTEVLLRLYEREGMAFLPRLNGMFAIAIHDARSDTLHLARDRIGVKPLYLHDDGQRLTFASEIKALLAGGIPRTMDHQALHAFLTFNYVPPPLTLFAGVCHLMPGTCLSITRTGAVSTRRWWDLSRCEAVRQSEAAWIEEFNATLDDAVHLRLRADVPFGAFLSGGVDSSTVVGMMCRHLETPVNTYAIGFHDPRFDESPFAAEAATRFGTRHILQKVDENMLDLWPMAIWHCDQPHGDISFLPTYRVAELAAREVKVVLTGDGGDELFAGYDKYRQFFARDDAHTVSDASFRQSYLDSISLFGAGARQSLYSARLAAAVAGQDPHAGAAPLFAEAAHMDRINQALYIDMQWLLPGNNLVKPDRMGMAVSLEARTPFLDYRMMELAFRMPGNLKLHRGETKYLFKKAVAPLIGEGLAYRRKQMFTVPVGEWFRDSLSGFVADLLLSPRALARDLFNPTAIRQILAEHRARAPDRTREIRALIAVELWARIFLDPPTFDGTRVPDYALVGVDALPVPTCGPTPRMDDAK